MHAGWDVLHHVYGHPIWPFMPTSSLGCLLFDTAIACWFVSLGSAGAVPASRPAIGVAQAAVAST